ncbi:MAG: SIMPL domain-containing protein [Pseudomonadota bacterium]
MQRIIACATGALLWVSAPLMAEGLDYQLVNLQVEAQREVDNDTMTVVLEVSHQSESPSGVAEQINRDMQWAVEEAGKVDGVEQETRHYRTFPVYEKNRLRAWRGSQSLELTGTNFAALSELSRVLQERLQISGMHFSPSPDTREALEQHLIDEAIERFQARAEQVAEGFGARGYELVNIDINTQGSRPPGVYRNKSMMAMEAAPDQAPAVEAGSTQISVSANGQIQLK